MKLNITHENVYKFQNGNEEFTIRQLKVDDPVNEITDLLHRAYKQLGDLGFRYLATHQDDVETQRRLDNGTSYLALHKEKIIATITLYSNKSDNNSEFYKRKGVVHFGQFGIDPQYQKKGIGKILMDMIEIKARDSGASEIALDTAEGADHLIKFYEKRGYEIIEYVQWEVTNYRSVIMSKKFYNEL
ncbi:MAG: GNAT family N-acetyltransferase [Ignavibacteria bacterium]